MSNFDFEDEGIRSVSEQADAKLRMAVTTVKKWRSAIMVTGIFIITLAMPLLTVDWGDPEGMDFWLRAVYSLIIATLCYYIFFPIGSRTERTESKTYIPTFQRWEEMSTLIRKFGLMEAFYSFCRVRVSEEREETRLLYIEAAGLPLRIYEAEYAGKTKKELRKIRRRGTITKKQEKYIAAANGEIRVNPINASLILFGLAVKNINDVGRQKAKRLWDYGKPLTLILTMVIRTIIEVGANRAVSWTDYLADTVINLTVILTWSFAGFRFGIQKAKEDESDAKGRTEFIDMFLERNADGISRIQKRERRSDGEDVYPIAEAEC